MALKTLRIQNNFFKFVDAEVNLILIYCPKILKKCHNLGGGGTFFNNSIYYFTRYNVKRLNLKISIYILHCLVVQASLGMFFEI